jgi:hypothetical protein
MLQNGQISRAANPDSVGFSWQTPVETGRRASYPHREIDPLTNKGLQQVHIFDNMAA